MKISDKKLKLNESLFEPQGLSIKTVPGFAQFLVNMKTKDELEVQKSNPEALNKVKESDKARTTESLLESDRFDSIQVGTCFMFNELNTIYCVLREYVDTLVVENEGVEKEVFGEIINTNETQEIEVPVVEYASFMHKQANKYIAGKEWLEDRVKQGLVHILTEQELKDITTYTDNKLYNNADQK